MEGVENSGPDSNAFGRRRATVTPYARNERVPADLGEAPWEVTKLGRLRDTSIRERRCGSDAGSFGLHRL